MKEIAVSEMIESKIYLIRRQKVMLDSDLSALYGVSTKVLMQAVKRNIKRFPKDFMFQLKNQELINLRSQIVTSSFKHGGRRYLPYAFTEHGALMIASVLNTPQAIEASLYVVRAFIKLREMVKTHKNLAKKLEELEKRYDGQFQVVFEAIYQLMEIEQKPKRKIGFLAKRDIG
ncbi:MAG: ORF6N domain-containing protein [Nitrospirota bacterium]